MYRIGTDLVEIERIRKSTEIQGFVKKVFSEEEQAFFALKSSPYPSMAANWAGKEAFAKALGTGVRGFSLNEVAVLRDEFGKPYYRLSGRAERLARGLSLDVSLTHTRDFAMAVCIAFKTEGNT